jgi:hypothetical protein
VIVDSIESPQGDHVERTAAATAVSDPSTTIQAFTNDSSGVATTTDDGAPRPDAAQRRACSGGASRRRPEEVARSGDS